MRISKRRLAASMHALRLDWVGFMVQRAFLSPFIRAVNYHDVSPQHAAAFEEQLIYFKRHYDVVGPDGLEAIAAGARRGSRPGLALTFDDGLRSHADVVAPLLERHGLVGWFMVPSGFLDSPVSAQKQFAVEHDIFYSGYDCGDGRIAMTWDDARRLASVHEVSCHTSSHIRLSASLSPSNLDQEIRMAKRHMESKLGRPVETFAWVGGEESAYSRSAAQAIADAGFRFSFMTNNQVIRPRTNRLQLQRTNIEAYDSPSIVRFQLCGVLDLLYLAKRRRVNRLTQVAMSS